MNITISQHARERMAERGVLESEVNFAIQNGERFSAKFGRIGFRCNFSYDDFWNGKKYGCKQVEVLAVDDAAGWIVATVLAKYF
ncbi:MAG TPA: DUF4258 domain-containing protein [bacterium]|nr:DUF4258 domain-containing protein [bacterium]